nr:hypothetical protein [Tanacetum cinerariifolium]
MYKRNKGWRNDRKVPMALMDLCVCGSGQGVEARSLGFEPCSLGIPGGIARVYGGGGRIVRPREVGWWWQDSGRVWGKTTIRQLKPVNRTYFSVTPGMKNSQVSRGVRKREAIKNLAPLGS